MKKSTPKLLLGILLLFMVACTVFVACDRGTETPEPQTTVGSDFVPETTPGSQLVAAGALEAMIIKDGWKVRPDPNSQGKKAGWYNTKNPSGTNITIPGTLTDIGEYCSEAWFSVKFDNQLEVSDDQRVWLELTGAGYVTEVWLNGQSVGSHKGYFGTFALDVTDAMKYDESNVLYIYSLCPSDTFSYDGTTGKSLRSKRTLEDHAKCCRNIRNTADKKN